jgi:hypothetical protein
MILKLGIRQNVAKAAGPPSVSKKDWSKAVPAG